MGENEQPACLGAGQMVALNARADAPEWVMLVPKGPRIVGNDGRVFTLDNPGGVVDAFAKSGLKLPIDINHAQYHKASKGEASPAVGWIEQLEARDGAIWGRVEWNSRGESALKGRDYRYISPGLRVDGDGRVLGIIHAGLVNQPNFAMAALNAEGTSMKNLFAKLGLPETATENDCIAVFDKLEASLNAARTASPEDFVRREDYEAANGAVIALNAQIVADKKAARDKEVVAFIDQGVKDGKITPGSKDQYLALCASDEGFAAAKGLVDATPSFFARQKVDETALKSEGDRLALDPLKREIMENCGHQVS